MEHGLICTQNALLKKLNGRNDRYLGPSEITCSHMKWILTNIQVCASVCEQVISLGPRVI